MAYTIVRHQVEDYEKWKTVFEGAKEFRKSYGEISTQVFRDTDNPNTVTVLNKWSDLNKAKEFFTLDEIKQKMKESGMVSEPTIHFLNEE
jgi:heme-degrading monooxygenase HmoA